MHNYEVPYTVFYRKYWQHLYAAMLIVLSSLRSASMHI